MAGEKKKKEVGKYTENTIVGENAIEKRAKTKEKVGPGYKKKLEPRPHVYRVNPPPQLKNSPLPLPIL